MSSWLLLLLLIWPLLWLVRLLSITRLLLGIEFRLEKVFALQPAEVPSHVREASQRLVDQLEKMGFALLGGLMVRRGDDSVRDDFAVVLEHTVKPVRALICLRPESARLGQCWLSLRTTLSDGTELSTDSFAPEEIVPLPSGMQVEVMEGAAPADQWQKHMGRIASVENDAWRCGSIERAALREEDVCKSKFAQLAASGEVAERQDGVVSYRTVPGFRRAVRLLKQISAQKKAQRGRSPGVPPVLSDESRATFELVHYRQGSLLLQGKLSRRTKAVISAVSFVLFAGVLAWSYSPTVAITLLIALVVHEFGHLAGMWLFGYKDTQLLFIPFFGGAAIGHDDHALPAWKHVVIILLGPLPGILIGMGLLAYSRGGGSPEWLFSAAITTVVLNAFNLLPILPLDGGQIVDYAIASRFPRARVFFLAASAVGLLGVSLLLSGVKILLAVAITMLLRLPTEWKLAQLRREVREEFPDGGDEEPIVRRLLAGFREAQWAKVAIPQRLQLIRGLQRVLRMPRPGIGTMALAIAGYTAPLWCGVPLAVWAAQRKGEAEVRSAEQLVRSAGLLTEPLREVVEVPADSNGAIPYAEAAARYDGVSAGKRKADAEVVALLRTAAHREKFVPNRADEGSSTLPWARRFERGGLATVLTDQAEEKLRFGDAPEALALALDALKLVRLMDSAPTWQTWSAHQRATTAAWNIVEEVTSTGANLPPDMLDDLRQLIDEPYELQMASRMIPRDFIEEARMMDELATRSETGRGARWILAMIALGTGSHQAKAELMREAVGSQEQLKTIADGTWPEFNHDQEHGWRRSMLVAQLGDSLARMRQARAALLIAERRQRGAAPQSIEDLGLASHQLTHPATGEPMRWSRREALEVLVFPTAMRGMDDEMEGNELVWRLPKRG